MPQNNPPSLDSPPRWAASRDRVIHGVRLMCRRSLRDVARETRKDLRARRVPVEEWLDDVVIGRGGNAASDFLLRFAELLHRAGECPQRIKARLGEIAHRVADVAHAAHKRA